MLHRISILAIATILLLGCGFNRIESVGKYSVYSKLDDSSTNVLVISGDETSYSYKAKLNIDYATLVDYGEFLADKNKVYRYYETSDVTLILELDGADRASFEALGNSIYAKDKNNVYNSRNGIVEKADVETFVPIHIDTGDKLAHGKDKNHYFFWSQIVTDTVGFSETLKK